MVPGTQRIDARPAMPQIVGLIVAGLGVAITLVAALGVRTSVERRIETRFNQVAAARAERLGFEFGRYHDDLGTLAGHVGATEVIDKKTFDRLTSPRAEALVGVQALAWVTAPAEASPAASRDDQQRASDPLSGYIVRFIEPLAGNERELGRDFGSDEVQRQAFERARRSAKPVLTPPMRTANFPYEAPLYRAAIAVHGDRRVPPGERAAVRGYLVGVYRAQSIIDSVMRSAKPALALRVTDRSEPIGRNLLAIYERPADIQIPGKATYSANLEVGGRVWELEFAPTDEFIAANRTDEPLLVLLLGLALTAAAAIAALVSARWRQGVLSLVAQRTAELAFSEARQRAVVANMADALVVVDSEGTIESVNAAARRLFGWDAQEVVGRDITLLVPQAAASSGEQDGSSTVKRFHPGALATADLYGLRYDGTKFPLAIALSQVEEQSGSRHIALMRDLTRERRAERAMSAFIAGTSNVTGRAFLDAATRSLAEALGVRYAIIAETTKASGMLRIVSLWSGQSHEPERFYELAGEPCEEVFGQQLRCHRDALTEKFPRGRLINTLQAQCYIGHPLHAANGKPLGIVALLDVNPLGETALASSLLSMAASRVAAEIERLESDEALLRSRERLELAVEGSQLALWDLNVQTGEVFLSGRWSVMMGDAFGPTLTTISDLFARVHPEDRAVVERAYRNALCATSPFYEVTHRVMRRDAGTVWVRSHGKVSERDGNGRALRLVGTNADVTWEKTTVEEVARRERELRTISDNVPATIVRLDRDFRYLYANRRYAMLVGIGIDALQGRRLIEVLGEASYQAIEPHFKRALDGDMVTYDREVSIGGRRRWLEVTVIPDVNAEWEVQGCFAIGLDITERKELDRRMIDARKNAEAAARAKSEFLAMMSHEIRTPMNGVLGLAGLLLDTRLNAEQQGYAETLHRSATSLLDILNDILDMSKIEAGKLELEPIRFDLIATVEDVIALWAPKAATKALELAVQIESDCPRRVVGDPGRIRQVLGNLVGNAIKFTQTGYVLLRITADGNNCEDARVLFEVEDSGVGITAEARERLFQPFTQADASTTRRFGGTGLGLAICQRLVRLMGGEIGVDSTPGRGARFWFSARLPADESQPSPAPRELQDVRVLLADDHPVNRMALRKQLQAFGMRVVCASDAHEALQRMSAAMDGEPFQVAVLDHRMPGIDGMELGRRLRADPRWQSLPMLLLTSSGYKCDAAQARAAGFAGSLPKPARSDVLRATLEAVVAGKLIDHIPMPARAPVSVERFQGKVLLVEDNEVNRRVAIAVLQKLGLDVWAAVDGHEALERIGSESFDLVLMDMHMPEMDGLEASRAIRSLEHNGSAHLPIIAMTANVMPEARAACFDAGMDDFLSKPFSQAQLAEVLGRWLPQAAAAGESIVTRASATDFKSGPLDHSRLESLRAAMGDDFVELIPVFLDSATEMVRAMHGAWERAQLQDLYRQAHTLKSSAANLGAMVLSRLARRLETDARDRGLDDGPARIDELSAELERVRPLLMQVVTQTQAGACNVAG